MDERERINYTRLCIARKGDKTWKKEFTNRNQGWRRFRLRKLAGKPRCRVKTLPVTAECAQAIRGGQERASYNEACERDEKVSRTAGKGEGRRERRWFRLRPLACVSSPLGKLSTAARASPYGPDMLDVYGRNR
jgi:hypothetical protein